MKGGWLVNVLHRFGLRSRWDGPGVDDSRLAWARAAERDCPELFMYDLTPKQMGRLAAQMACRGVNLP
jgi:hypothetical protein